MRPLSTLRFASRSRAQTAAETASCNRWLYGCHSACQAPAARWYSCSALASKVAMSPGACLAQPRIATAATGLLLFGIADEPPRRGAPAAPSPPPEPSATSPTSVCASRATSRAILDSAAHARADTVATSMIRSRSVCQGSGGSARPSSSASSVLTRSPSPPRDASVPAAPPYWTASRVSRTNASHSIALSSPASQPAATTPKVVGTACWSSVRPIMSVPRFASASRAAASAAAVSSATAWPSASRASSIAAVSMMSWLVAPWCTADRAPGSVTRLVSTRARPGTGLPVSTAARPSSATSAGPKSPASAALVTAAPAPAGASPARSSARARPASAASIDRSQAASSATVPPPAPEARANTPSKKLGLAEAPAESDVLVTALLDPPFRSGMPGCYRPNMTALPAGGPELPQRRTLLTEIPGPASRALMERRSAAVARGVSTTLPVFVTAAGGGVLLDADGNSLIDFGSGIAVTSVGNAATAVVDRVQAQVAQFTHTCFMVTPYEGYVEVCEELARRTPGTHEKRSALFNSGAEAVENAIKIARHYTGRQAVVAFDHAYHGRTNLTMALTAKNMPYKDKFGPFAGEIYRMPMAYPLRWPGGPGQCAKEALDVISTLIHTQVGEDNVAAVIIEPIQGEGGFVVPPDGFLPGLADFCRQHGILLIADEIQTGFCRTGDWFACDHEGVVPDLITTAKGIAGGMPLAGVTGRAEVMDSVHASGLGGTYGGNPVACAGALGAIETMEAEDLAGRARRIGEIMAPRLRKLADTYPIIADVRGRGAMLAIELAQPGSLEPDAATTGKVAKACHANGLVTLTCGTFGNVLRFLPPLVIGEDLLEEGLSILEDAFASV